MKPARVLLQRLSSEPVAKPKEASGITGLSMVSSYQLIGDFERLNILSEITETNETVSSCFVNTSICSLGACLNT
jgi:hypothetical protein